MKKVLSLFMVTLVCLSSLKAQDLGVHQQSKTYEWPANPEVREKLDQWQDQKFGMIIHWGLYAVPGIIESWGLCSEDWINRPDSMTYNGYKSWYWGLKDEFNPVNFDPEKWAEAADQAGMKYLVFTTKHHDGFSMFDTKQTDFKITAGPFANHPKANVAKYVFEAFRNKGFMIGAYFSKPDWHSQDFWWDKYATANRNVNYDIRKHPERWNSFKQFTFNQISELMHDYGKIDILWLDGGWVRPRETVNEEVLSWGAPIPEWDQKVDMPAIAAMARKAQPGILMVDRTVHGPYENYQTPERSIPQTQLPYPWESCITLGNNWGHVPNERLKSPDRVVHDLIEIVAKGGSLLLGVGPKPDGTIDAEVVKRLQAVGEWMNQNGKAIYGTRITEHYQDGEVFFTKGKKGEHYALARIAEGEALPETVSWTGNLPAKGTKMTLVATGQRVRWKKDGDQVVVSVPKAFRKKHKTYPALAFSFQSND
ncbi:alpha-L-fucosidase [Sunxiuqinia elliptica]|uniref:alpha-L-fucosidase n=1 Tax=Sunxiuqinia elliptica TaxID=655355 RepID=A0A1I2CR19_9BACT|nr:alpha-L-fucosidase [Sunxiuqinia elliptica]SFE70605.1 alpha-L-fucosidase [Sunxiuqinia elliptica]